MDFGTAALFFAMGLGAALLARNFTKWRGGGGGMEGLPVKNGSVRMDLMAGKPRAGAQEGEEATDLAETPAARPEDVPGRSGRSRPRRKKR